MSDRSLEVQAILQLEAELLAVWREFLGAAHITPTDHFFECGGTSLSAARLATLLNGRLNKTLSPADILAYPSVRLLAEKLSSQASVQKKTDTQARAARQRTAFQASRR